MFSESWVQKLVSYKSIKSQYHYSSPAIGRPWIFLVRVKLWSSFNTNIWNYSRHAFVERWEFSSDRSKMHVLRSECPDRNVRSGEVKENKQSSIWFSSRSCSTAQSFIFRQIRDACIVLRSGCPDRKLKKINNPVSPELRCFVIPKLSHMKRLKLKSFLNKLQNLVVCLLVLPK